MVFSASVYADEQVPGIVAAVESDPYYFSEGDFGIKILKFFERSLEPYLVPGKTTERSSIEDISAEYQISTEHILQKTIVQERERAIVFIVHFSNGDISETQTYKTFLKFTHTEDIPKYSGPSSYQLISYGLELESLPSIDKQWFYDNIISRSINIGKKPQPFDIDVDIVTGDSHVLQTWQYRKCEVVEYTPFLDENLVRLKFVGDFVSEIRERVVFGCDGFHVDFEMKVPFTIPKTTLKSANFVPDKTDRAEQILVQFSGGELELEKPFYSFSKFMPVTQRGTAPILSPGYTIGATLQFTLESLPSKDKTEYYQALSRYILPGKDPEPFDTTIHLVTGSGEILQTWKYTKCSATNYVTFFLDNLLFYKFKQTSGSEIRDKTYFECTSLVFNPVELGEKQKEITGIFVPDDNQRAQTFVVHFQGPDIAPPKTVTSFTKFSPITNEELPILLPGAPFGKEPKFYLESLPSIENEWYYQLMSRYINRGAIPDLFVVTVDVLSGDGTTIQTWQYRQCEVLEYKPFFEDILVKQKFTKKLQPEIRDRTIFECDGFSVDGNLYSPESVPQKTLDSSRVLIFCTRAVDLCVFSSPSYPCIRYNIALSWSFGMVTTSESYSDSRRSKFTENPTHSKVDLSLISEVAGLPLIVKYKRLSCKYVSKSSSPHLRYSHDCNTLPSPVTISIVTSNGSGAF